MNSGSGPFSSSFSEADLHGFVDGRLEPSRQAEMARRLKSHAADRARTDAWREQNELIRATFSEVEGEPVPVSLCLTAPVRLRCVASDGLSLSGQASSFLEKPRFTNESKRRRARVLAISALMVCAGVAGAWIMLDHASTTQDRPAPAASRDAASQNLDDSLAGRTMEAMAGAAASDHQPVRGLPAITIPDLTGSGFTFTGVSAPQSDPPALLLFYEDGASRRIVIGVANASPVGRPAVSAPNRHTVIWHKSGTTFALTGTIAQDRLTEIAATLQTGPVSPEKKQ
jgi:anti-sigma factor RsiW